MIGTLVWGCMCGMLCDHDLTRDLAVMTLTFEILSEPYPK